MIYDVFEGPDQRRAIKNKPAQDTPTEAAEQINETERAPPKSRTQEQNKPHEEAEEQTNELTTVTEMTEIQEQKTNTCKK